MNIYLLKLNYEYIENNLYLYNFLDKISYERKKRFLRNKDEKKRYSILFSELLLKYCILKELNTAHYTLLYNKYGKPYLDIENFHFSISHSHDIIILGCSKNNLGIDLEYKKDRNISFIKGFFTLQEQQYILKSNDRLETFYQIWTLKESYIKALGVGLYKDLKSFTITPLISKLDEYFFRTFSLENYIYSVCSLEEIEENLKLLDVREILDHL